MEVSRSAIDRAAAARIPQAGPPTVDQLGDIREAIGEHLHMLKINANVGYGYASIADDVGLEYAIRRARAYLIQAGSLFQDLSTMKSRRPGGAK